MSADNYRLIRRAIIDKRQVRATYQGRLREMCPHALGTKNGRRQALFFQFAGESARGLPPDGDWRCLPVDELTEVSLRDGDWHTDDRYGRSRQTCVDEIDVAVAA
ncbi:MAG: hypothetical protein QM729_17345 [Solirubrobacterales bacterium]